jgi:hypothetical protein
MKLEKLKNVSVLNTQEMGALVGGGEPNQTFKRYSEQKGYGITEANSGDHESGYYQMQPDGKSALFTRTWHAIVKDGYKNGCDLNVPDIIRFEALKSNMVCYSSY